MIKFLFYKYKYMRQIKKNAKNNDKRNKSLGQLHTFILNLEQKITIFKNQHIKIFKISI